MQHLTIQQESQGKGRSFEAILLAHVEADALWDGGSTGTDDYRPVWMVLTGSDSNLRAFVANLRMGRKAEIASSGYSRRRKGTRYELLRSAGYQYLWQRTSAGPVVTAYLPDLFRLDPGMVDPKGVSFCILPPQAWVQEQKVDTTLPVQHMSRLSYQAPADKLASWLPLAALFCAYLDRRTRCPLVADHRFYLQVFCAALEEGIASWSYEDNYSYYHDPVWGTHRHLGFHESDTVTVGLHPGVVCKASHEALEQFLATQVAVYFHIVNKTGRS